MPLIVRSTEKYRISVNCLSTTGVAIYLNGPFILNMDPVFAQVWGVKLWYYGLAYSLGFLSMFVWVMLRRDYLGISSRQVWDFSLLFSLCALIGGRIFGILAYEWSLFRENYQEVFAFWHGGMSPHGVTLGVLCGIFLFCFIHKKKFLLVADEIVIPVALFLTLGCIGKHINGEVYGSVTTFWWAVKFPYAEGFRHPVALYEAFKNLLIIVILISVAHKTVPGQGRMLGHFMLWYGLFAIITGCFQDAGPLLGGIDARLFYNTLVAAVGLLFILRSVRKKKTELNTLHFAPASLIARLPSGVNAATCLRVILFLLILLFALTIPSGLTQQHLHDLIAKQGI